MKKGFVAGLIVILIGLIVVASALYFGFIKNNSGTGTTSTISSTAISGGEIPGESAAQPSAVKDCGTDENCFVQYANLCQPAKVSITSHPADPFGMVNISETMSYQIVSKGAQNCTAQVSIADYKAIYTQDVVNYLVAQGKNQTDISNMEDVLAKAQNGLSQTCTLGLDKKMGDALVQTFMQASTTMNVSTSGSLGGTITSTTTGALGLVCVSQQESGVVSGN